MCVGGACGRFDRACTSGGCDVVNAAHACVQRMQGMLGVGSNKGCSYCLRNRETGWGGAAEQRKGDRAGCGRAGHEMVGQVLGDVVSVLQHSCFCLSCSMACRWWMISYAVPERAIFIAACATASPALFPTPRAAAAEGELILCMLMAHSRVKSSLVINSM